MPKPRESGKNGSEKLKQVDLQSKIDDLKNQLKGIVLDGLEFANTEGFKLIPKDDKENKLSKDEFEFISGIVINPYFKQVSYQDLTKVYGRMLFSYYMNTLPEEQGTDIIGKFTEINFDPYTALWSIEDLFNKIGRRVTNLTDKTSNEAIFEEEWVDFCKYLKQSPLDYIVSFPIRNLHLEIQEVVLSETLKIRLLTPKEKYFWGIQNFPEISTCIEIKLALKYLINREVAKEVLSDIFERADNIILLLNLFFLCNTQISNDIFLENEPLYCRRPPLLAPGFETKPSSLPFIQAKLAMNEEMVKPFKKCFENFATLFDKKKSKWPIITQRLKYLFFRDRPSDTVLDLAIVFEFLMGTGAEITFSLAINTASILGENQTKKKDIYNDMKNFYKLRSDIVHGRDFERELEKLGGITFIEKVFGYLREVILKYLEVVAQDKEFGDFIESKYFQSNQLEE